MKSATSSRGHGSAAGESRLAAFRFDDPDQYVGGTPHQVFAQLRGASPFSWQRASQDPGGGFWLALKHRDVVAISKDPQLFATQAPLLADPLPRELWPAFPALAMIADNLMTYEPERHSVFRRLANPLFAPARIAAEQAQVRAACVQVLDRVRNRPRFDFAEEVALALPVEVVLGAFLGVPREDLAQLTRCVLTINAMDDPVFRPTGEALLEAAEELCAYGLSLLRRLQASPGPDLLSELMRTRSLSDVSAEQMFMTYWFPLAAGAFDTTASSIAGGVRALLQFPEQLALLRADPALVPTAVEEIVRWVSPVVYFRRTATADTDFGGQRIRKGQRLVLCYASANRDEDVFSDPDRFQVGRTPNAHVSFGHGPHFCLGARLSSFVMRIFLEEFLERLPGLRLDGEVVHTRSNWMNRIRSMPVALASTGPTERCG